MTRLTGEQDNPRFRGLVDLIKQGDAAFVVEDGRLEKRRLRTGLRGTRMIEIMEGVKEGEQVATPARPNWRDGMRVRAAPVKAP